MSEIQIWIGKPYEGKDGGLENGQIVLPPPLFLCTFEM